MSLDILDRIDQRLTRIEQNLALVASEQRRIGLMLGELVATPCPRCRLQLIDTEPPPATEPTQ